MQPSLLRHCLRSCPALVEAAARSGALPALASVPSAGRAGDSHRRAWWEAAVATTATVLGGVAAAHTLLQPAPARCEPAPIGFAAGGAGAGSTASSSSWVPGWLSWLWGGGRSKQPDNAFIRAIAEDPRVAVALAFALPSLSLSFGFVPSKPELDAAAALVQPALAQQLRPWEVDILLWGAARLGYHPGPGIMQVVKERLAAALREAPTDPGALTPQGAAMAGWALSATDELTPELWAAVNNYLSRCPADRIDEVALIHLYQAALFADRAAITGAAHPTEGPGSSGTPAAAHLPRMRSPSDEVRATLAAGGCPLPLINRCEAVYKAAAAQPGFDGPALIELAMVHMLVRIYQEGGGGGGGGVSGAGGSSHGGEGSGAYGSYFADLNLMDVQRAQQLLEDPYLLTKFKREVADKRARQNNFTRQLADISRTLTSLGVYHVVQAAVEDGLVHVDIALPDYKIAFFLEGAERGPAGPAGGGRSGAGGKGSGGQVPLSALDPEGVVLSGFVANETPGSKAAKLRLLERLGWRVFGITWVDSTKDDRAKRATLLALIDRAGRDQLMRGRVSSALHGALRGAEESKLGKDRFQTASAGQYITRQQQP